MSAGKHEDNPHGYILIDATKYEKKKRRNKDINSKKSANRKNRANTLHCVLCGLEILSGGLLKHKELAHGEKIVARRAHTDSPKNQWITIIRGGLPSLGKRN